LILFEKNALYGFCNSEKEVPFLISLDIWKDFMEVYFHDISFLVEFGRKNNPSSFLRKLIKNAFAGAVNVPPKDVIKLVLLVKLPSVLERLPLMGYDVCPYNSVQTAEPDKQEVVPLVPTGNISEHGC
jgi:hypothetical protein